MAGYIQTLRRSLTTGKITWVRPECLHVTLRFLGETPPSLVERLRGWESCLKSTPAAPVAIGPLDAFPNLRTPKVLFLRVDPVDPLKELFHRLEQRLAEAGFTQEPKAYTPHLTIARVRRPPQRIEPSPFLIQDTLTSVTLFESRLTPAGPIYTTLSTAALEI